MSFATGGPSADELERQKQAAICANAMGRRQATTLLTRLLEDGEGGQLPISAAEDMLFHLKQDLAKCQEPLAFLKTAVLDQASRASLAWAVTLGPGIGFANSLLMKPTLPLTLLIGTPAIDPVGDSARIPLLCRSR